MLQISRYSQDPKSPTFPGRFSIACATDPYQVAQDVASAIRTFRGECFYDTTLGIPYWQAVLGQLPPASFIRSELVHAALTVPNVTSANVTQLVLSSRKCAGEIAVTDDANHAEQIICF
ncbi:hypothetical protein AWB75_07010 [Caballeronia catudaia]|uniref:Uncharacterized protein n=2 Tax=Caballeronia catudaia TaxID=1777136 RepID=A0A158DPI9_9BURK|nr:hypothetical protein AWB75_07010 [Caballeronia catudaia]